MAKLLTPGERRVLLAYVEEETHERAAARLNISPQTLKNHLGSVYKKVGARKAHTAVYRLAMLAGCDPLATETSSSADNLRMLSRPNPPESVPVGAIEEDRAE